MKNDPLHTTRGGPAFPLPVPCSTDGIGMSLRDWFAGQIVSSVYAEAPNNQTFESIAMEAFRIADAMLAERERK